jgi:poly(A) polymerase
MTIVEARREFAEEIVRRLREAGYQSLWAGGCVRDLILDRLPSDYDVATDARPDQVMEALPFHTIPVGISFGVIRVNHPRRRGVEVEVATFRNDGTYVDGRRPESVSFTTAREDAARRDFTINGMFLDPLTGELIDYVGGRADLDNRLLRAIGDPLERFREDKLRLLRAVRFASRFDLTIEPKTFDAIRLMADEVRTVSPERIAQELRRMLAHASRASAMRLARETGLLAAILPELTNSGDRESDAWDRRMRILEALADQADFTLAFAALLRFVGPGVAGEVASRLRLSNAERDRIVWLVDSRGSLDGAETFPPSRLKPILAHPGIGELLALERAVAVAFGADVSEIAFCERYLAEQPDGPINPPPLVTGDDLVRHGLTPGRHFARILDDIRKAQLDGIIHNKDEALSRLKDRSG